MLEFISMICDCVFILDVCYYFFDLFEIFIEFDVYVLEWKFWWVLV